VRHLWQVSVTLKQHHMYLNVNKIETCQPALTYLGNCVGSCGIQLTADRAQAMWGWPEPENTSELKSIGFLRPCSWAGQRRQLVLRLRLPWLAPQSELPFMKLKMHSNFEILYSPFRGR